MLPAVKLAVIKVLAQNSAAIKYFQLCLMILLFVFQFSQMLGARAGSDWQICPGKGFSNSNPGTNVKKTGKSDLWFSRTIYSGYFVYVGSLKTSQPLPAIMTVL